MLCLLDSVLTFQKQVSGRSQTYFGDIENFNLFHPACLSLTGSNSPKSNWTGQQLKLDLHVEEMLYDNQADEVYFPIRTENL